MAMKVLLENDVYRTCGKERWMPANEFARFVCDLRETKTIVKRDVETLLKYGCQVIYSGPPSRTLDELGVSRSACTKVVRKSRVKKI